MNARPSLPAAGAAAPYYASTHWALLYAPSRLQRVIDGLAAKGVALRPTCELIVLGRRFYAELWFVGAEGAQLQIPLDLWLPRDAP